MSNKHKMKSIFLQLYSPIFRVFSSLLLIIILLLTSIALGLYIYTYTNKISKDIEQLTFISHSIENQLSFNQFFIQNYRKRLSDSIFKKNIDNTLASLLDSLSDVFGLGYAKVPKYGHYAIYIYRDANSDSKISKIYMNTIYSKKNSSYNKRPWFTSVLAHKRAISFTPQLNWFGTTNDYEMTYAYPVFDINSQLIAVGTIDVNIQRIINILEKSSNNKGIYSLFFEIGQYSGGGNKPGFYSIHNNILAYQYPLTSYQNISHHWMLHNFALFRKFKFAHGGLNFLIRINILPFIIVMIMILVSLIMISLFIIYLSKKILKKKISYITSPISSASKQLKNLIHDEQLEQNIYPIKSTSSETETLTQSIRSLHENLKNYIEIEKNFNQKQSQLALARKIQSSFLLGIIDLNQLQKEGLDVASYYAGAEDLSGDIIDILIHGEYLYLLIGDSTDKGAAASIFSLFVLSHFRFLAANSFNPKQILEKLNNYLCALNTENMFISGVCIRVDMNSNRIEVANAGHNMPIIISQHKQAISIESNDLVLGLMKDVDYQLKILEITNIHSIMLYTDGITETMSNEQYFDRKKLEEFTISVINRPSREIIEKIISKVIMFSDDSTIIDDRSLILIKFQAGKVSTNE